MTKEKTQIDKFREAARALGSVRDDEYDDALAKVAKAEKLSEEQIKELVRRKRGKAER
ncbi:hypothetical protein [Mesorhizobium sp.]|uniref:hypothetical protein n=1 Tax=Mesorhizobium sp. TaxID=1871066 RepID=UPI0025D5FA23|nr:hypothetical protein [Mesorhizobium sp.]